MILRLDTKRLETLEEARAFMEVNLTVPFGQNKAPTNCLGGGPS